LGVKYKTQEDFEALADFIEKIKKVKFTKLEQQANDEINKEGSSEEAQD